MNSNQAAWWRDRRFDGPMLSALASHPMFTTERWDPTLSAKDVLMSVKAFLEVCMGGDGWH